MIDRASEKCYLEHAPRKAPGASILTSRFAMLTSLGNDLEEKSVNLTSHCIRYGFLGEVIRNSTSLGEFICNLTTRYTGNDFLGEMICNLTTLLYW